MKVRQLIEKLKLFDAELDVVVLVDRQTGRLEVVETVSTKSIVFSSKQTVSARNKFWRNGHELDDPEYPKHTDDEERAQTCLFIGH